MQGETLRTSAGCGRWMEMIGREGVQRRPLRERAAVSPMIGRALDEASSYLEDGP